MVSNTVQLDKPPKYPDDENDDDGDDVSVASSAESRVECDGAVVLNNVQDKSPCFQNIEVTNSSDVHFGNKTYYQGPVTIKQILYSNPSQNGEEPSDEKLSITDDCGTDNSAYTPDPATNGVVKNGNINTNSSNNNSNINWTKTTKGNKWLQARTGKQLIIGTFITMLIVLCAIAVTVALLTTQTRTPGADSLLNEELDSNKPDNDPEAIGNVATLSRRDWLAEPPTHTTKLTRPVPNVIIAETNTQTCNTKSDCIFVIRHLQTSHKEGLSLWDIRYNFLIGGDGNIYEGRGWNVVSSTVADCNKNSIGIAFVGVFSYTSPTEKQINVARRLIGMGVRLGHITRNYKLVTSSQILGEGIGSSVKLDKAVQEWPHWSNVSYFDDFNLKQQFCDS